MNEFICSVCGTKYQSPETTPPPGIRWSDGHVCTPKPVTNEQDNRIYQGKVSGTQERVSET